MKNENNKKNGRKLMMVIIFIIISFIGIYFSNGNNLEMSKIVFDSFLSFLCVTLMKEYIKEKFKTWKPIVITVIIVIVLGALLVYINKELFMLLILSITISFIIFMVIALSYHLKDIEKRLFVFFIIFLGLVITLILNYISEISVSNSFWSRFFCKYDFNMYKFFSKYIFVSIIEIISETDEDKDNEKSRNQKNG
ncbi:FUSC family protein [Leptotrichia wadei]|uniref:FUSC family protein n=1 Tax=Leptotrichia wadei TaxID=157687 RepID=UPI0028D09516|nr:FUSC family protein [Leptotrichia wadei]